MMRMSIKLVYAEPKEGVNRVGPSVEKNFTIQNMGKLHHVSPKKLVHKNRPTLLLP